jgi:hypothetical protein
MNLGVFEERSLEAPFNHIDRVPEGMALPDYQ